ncbi:MAG: GNAT family N-acetyltransferase [Ruminococcus sp.]|nr:GNAT family N-acetyltransferase [Ruminococcus sp.]
MFCADGIADKLYPFFENFEDSVLNSFFEGLYGSAYCDDPVSPSAAVIVSGDFYFCAGDVSFAESAVKLAQGNRYATFMPENEKWAKALAEADGRLFITKRFRTRLPGRGFDPEVLKGYAGGILQYPGYKLEPINEVYYNKAKEQDWSAAFTSNFRSWEEFDRRAFGFVITHNGEIISGMSCYTVYSRGVEIEVATDERYRLKGLAKICGGAFLTECLHRGLIPHWDARNETSLAIAEKMGFEFKESYTALEYDQKYFV